jgi:hypothetical protein
VREVVLEALGHLVEEAHLVEGAGDAALGRGAVVRDHHDQRVVELADLLERVEQAPEVVVAVGDEPGEDLHHPRVQAPLVGGQRRPLGHVGITRRELRVRGHQPELLLAREDLLAVDVPAFVEGAGVAVGPLARDMVRRVRAAGRVVHEERLLGRVDMRVEDVLDRLVREVLAEVVAVIGQARLLGRAVVAVLQEHLRHHAVLERHPPVVARIARSELHDAGDAAGVVVAAGEDRGARGRAEGRRVHVRVARPGCRDAVDVRRLHEPAEAAELAVADVVEDDEEHVRRAVARADRGRPGGAGLLHRAPDHAREVAALGIFDGIVRHARQPRRRPSLCARVRACRSQGGAHRPG